MILDYITSGSLPELSESEKELVKAFTEFEMEIERRILNMFQTSYSLSLIYDEDKPD